MVRCWGSPEYGQLGYGNVRSNNNPPELQGDVPIGERVLSISTGGYHSCALLEGGRARCWGPNLSPSRNWVTATRTPSATTKRPASAGDVNVGGPVSEVVAGRRFTRALLTSQGAVLGEAAIGYENRFPTSGGVARIRKHGTSATTSCRTPPAACRGSELSRLFRGVG